MKQLHRPDLFAWSVFDEERNIDFNSICWVRPGGNVLIDPLPLSAHDQKHVEALGGAALVVVTNSDHVRDAPSIAGTFGARIAAPRAEPDVAADRRLSDGDEVVAGLIARSLDGSKTPGELALVLEETTLITGDLIRAHRAGTLMLLPDAKLTDRAAALKSIRRLSEAHDRIETVLVGDGWHLFEDGRAALEALLAGAQSPSTRN